MQSNQTTFHFYTIICESNFIHEVNITFYQRTLLGTSANQKRHYLKSYNNCIYLRILVPNTTSISDDICLVDRCLALCVSLSLCIVCPLIYGY